MLKRLTYLDYLNYCLGFLVLVSVLFPRLFGLGVLAYIGLLVYGLREKMLHFRINTLSVLFIALYVCYALGLILAIRDEFDPTYLEYKLSFLIVPIMLSFQPKHGNFSLHKIGSALIIAVFIVMIYGLSNSIGCYMQGGGRICFLTTHISPIHHPSYFVAILITSMYIAWLGWYRKWSYFNLKWVIPYTLIGLLYHIFSLSLAGILFLLLALMVLAMYGVYRRFGWKLLLLSAVLLPTMAYFFVTRVPQVEGEWNGAKWYADQYLKDPEAFVRNVPYPASGSEIRLVVWTVGWEVLKDHPLGVGTGNLDEFMAEYLVRYDQVELAKKNMNPHNQYIQTGIEIGWLGLCILLGIILYGSWRAIVRKNGLLLFIIGCLAFNNLFESMLQRQSGVVFFTLWICLLWVVEEVERRKSEALSEK